MEANNEQRKRTLIGRTNKKDLENMYISVWNENKELKEQLNTQIENSTEYQLLVKQMQDESNLKKIAISNLESYRERCKRLENETIEQAQKYAELQEAYNTILSAYDALKSDLNVMQAEMPHNARGAGRKPILSAAQRDEVRQLHAEGKSLRQIAAQMGVTHTAIAKILKTETN